MPIKFSVAKRGLLPHEEAELNVNDKSELRSLRPQLECQTTVDAVEFQSGSLRLPSVMPKGELMAALSTMQRVMLHELEKGNAVSLPGIGTFRLSLKGDIEVKDGHYHGRDVRVDGILFRPDRELLSAVRGFEVEQVPFGQAVHTGDMKAEACLAELFASRDTITHKDVAYAFGQTMSRGRITSLLNCLVREGRLVREGSGPQTRYRKL